MVGDVDATDTPTKLVRTVGVDERTEEPVADERGGVPGRGRGAPDRIVVRQKIRPVHGDARRIARGAAKQGRQAGKYEKREERPVGNQGV